ncbi:MAG: FAD-dependent oxidoreductase [Clostridia bacterium]|nr:FAD-dependent oxidoreductase [Clostridia bacterium]
MALPITTLKTELCVIGGGMAGVNVAITAARLGVKTVLVHERPMFGGNASSEIRMWVCGTQDYVYRETGIAEELHLENDFFNPTKNHYLADSILYRKVKSEKNITALLNCTCFDAKTEHDKIQSVTAYQMTTQTLYRIEADVFADCSGDSILAPLTNAAFMYGREAQEKYGEPMQTHTEKDNKTMGNSCLLQARKMNRKIPFRAPEWAEQVCVEKLKSKACDLKNPSENFWYIELGGVLDTIKDAENINERLIALCLGVWDTIKNSGEFDADEYDLEFLGFLGAKRESRRMTGDYVLTANDVMEGRVFSDTVAYGGWPLDDHNPEGFDGDKSNYIIKVRKPYGIPYRCLYSVNVENLFFAGRNISATHMAMSSARVMGTCSVIGQAVGVAAAICKKYSVMPRGVQAHMDELQQLLLQHDCYLPYVKRKVDGVCSNAQLIGAGERIRNGQDRDFPGENNAETLTSGEAVRYVFDQSTYVRGVKIVFDSDLQRKTFDFDVCENHHFTRCNVLENSPMMHMPKTLAKGYEIKIVDQDGRGERLIIEHENKRRNILFPIEREIQEISLTVFENWGGTPSTRVFTFEPYTK